jgi:hypothetical protein
MKTIYDLIQLISDETRMSEGMLHKYTFDLNLKHNWVSMYEHAEISTYQDNKYGTENVHEQDIFTMKSIDTESQIQEVYWSIYNNGRSSKKG